MSYAPQHENGVLIRKFPSAEVGLRQTFMRSGSTSMARGLCSKCCVAIDPIAICVRQVLVLSQITSIIFLKQLLVRISGCKTF